MTHFAGDTSKHPDQWSALWDKGDFLPFDRGMPNPAFEDTLTDRDDLLGSCFKAGRRPSAQRKRALVPGCGRGYDVLLLASFGYDSFGLEVSKTAVIRCYQEQETNGHKYPLKGKEAGAGMVTFLVGDFFASEWSSNIGDGTFDLIYDYTVRAPCASLSNLDRFDVYNHFVVDNHDQFLSALPPSFRPRWALRMSSLLTRDGNLICIEFPSAKDPKLGGPPYALPSSVYVEHLAHPGEELLYNEDTGHVKEGVSHASNSVALHRIAHWRPARTHEIGKGQDWVSIWRH